MYREALKGIGRFYPLYLFAAVAIAVSDSLSSRLVALCLSVFASGYVAFTSHRVILLGERFGLKDLFSNKDLTEHGESLFPFLFRYFAFVGVILVLVVIYGTFLGLSVGREQPEVAVLLVFAGVLVTFVFYAVLLGLWGTVLPAAAVGGDRTFGTALIRGRRRFWRTIWRLVSGSFGVFLFGLAVLFGAAILLPEAAFLDAWAFPFAGALVSLMSVHFAAVALSMAYRESEDD